MPPTLFGRPPLHDPLLGTPYRATALLGHGAMGEVFDAEHIALAKRVVAKILHRHLAVRPDQVARLRLEGRILAHLSHPNIVAVTDLQETPDARPYLIMEHLAGRNLRQEREARGCLPVAEAVAIAHQALAGGADPAGCGGFAVAGAASPAASGDTPGDASRRVDRRALSDRAANVDDRTSQHLPRARSGLR